MDDSKLSPKENLLSLLKQRDRVAEQVSLCDQAITFWEERMNTLFADMEGVEEEPWSLERDAKLHYFAKEIDTLLDRGKIENDAIDKLELESKTIYDKIVDLLQSTKDNSLLSLAKKHFSEKPLI